jgi:hypothetical protein
VNSSPGLEGIEGRTKILLMKWSKQLRKTLNLKFKTAKINLKPRAKSYGYFRTSHKKK